MPETGGDNPHGRKPGPQALMALMADAGTAGHETLMVGDTVTDNGSWQGTYTGDNVVRRLVAAGKTWKSYAENLPSTGYVGGDQGLYARRHNAFVWFSDDDRRVVVRITADFAIGHATANLTSYTPGSAPTEVAVPTATPAATTVATP